MVDQTPIRNTTEEFRDPSARLGLGLGLSMGGSDALTRIVTNQEAEGQRQLVNSDRLPAKSHEGSDDPYLALGFTFGPPDPGDPLFRPATLPPGWRRDVTDHAMHSKILDEHGRERVSVFYKAAFYDRRADMSLNSHYGYLSSALYYDTPVVLDDDWLPAATAIAELTEMATKSDERATEADGLAVDRSDSYWSERAAEHRAEAAKARALAESLS